MMGPFKLWLGQPAPDVFGDDVFALPCAFNTAMLWGALDWIALRLMDSRRHPPCRTQSKSYMGGATQ